MRSYGCETADNYIDSVRYAGMDSHFREHKRFGPGMYRVRGDETPLVAKDRLDHIRNTQLPEIGVGLGAHGQLGTNCGDATGETHLSTAHEDDRLTGDICH